MEAQGRGMGEAPGGGTGEGHRAGPGEAPCGAKGTMRWARSGRVQEEVDGWGQGALSSSLKQACQVFVRPPLAPGPVDAPTQALGEARGGP